MVTFVPEIVFMAIKKLMRSRDGYLGGVCAGIGEHYGVDTNVIRMGAILALFVGFPVPFAYLFALFTLSKAPKLVSGSVADEEVAAPRVAEVAWQADDVVLRYRQKIVPHTVGWRTLLKAMAVLFTTLMGVASSLAILSAIVATVTEVVPSPSVTLFFLSTLFDPNHLPRVMSLGTMLVQGLGIATFAGAVVPVNHSLRCTPSALIIGRPLLPDVLIALSEVSMVEQRPKMLEILLESGTLISVPLAGTEDIAAFVTALNRGNQQALAVHTDE